MILTDSKLRQHNELTQNSFIRAMEFANKYNSMTPMNPIHTMKNVTPTKLKKLSEQS